MLARFALTERIVLSGKSVYKYYISSTRIIFTRNTQYARVGVRKTVRRAYVWPKKETPKYRFGGPWVGAFSVFRARHTGTPFIF